MTSSRPVRVYRLEIAYPDREHAETYPGEVEWRHDPATGRPVPDEPTPRSWPVERLFLSRSGAAARATKLRKWGCTVTIRPSQVVTWEPSAEEQT